MSEIGHGYGSEWHLLRYLGYHRTALNKAILDAIEEAERTDGGTINWEDSLFSAKRQALHDDCESGGIEFIWDSDVTKLWNQYWPVRGTSPQWDAVGKLMSEEQDDWLLVEAKAHFGEMESPWHAKNAESQAMIRSAMADTAKVVTRGGVPTNAWLNKFYQYANRLAVLNFLSRTYTPPIPARLIFIYFYGELMPNCECPQTQDEWEDHLHSVHSEMDIDPQSPLMQRVHHVYLAVNPNARRKTLSGRLARNMVEKGEIEDVFTALYSEFERFRATREMEDPMVQYVARLTLMKWRQSNPGEENKYRMEEALKEYLEDRSE